MFTNYFLTAELARQRQSEMRASSAQHRLLRASKAAAEVQVAPSCPVVDLPSARAHGHAHDALVA